MPRKITPATSLENLRKEAKRWLKELRANNRDARARFERAYPTAPRNPVLRDVQHALAREYGHESWITLKLALETPPVEGAAPIGQTRTAEEYERLANDLVLAFDSRDQAALQRLNELYAATGQVGFKLFRRTDGKLLIPEAVKCLVMAAS